jgi:RNA polymerase III RPC4
MTPLSFTCMRFVAKQIIMNVSEGLSCEFQQQAVEIDMKDRTYLPLGLVQRTVVITPNLNEACEFR